MAGPDATPTLWGYNPVCKVTPVILHGIVSQDPPSLKQAPPEDAGENAIESLAEQLAGLSVEEKARCCLSAHSPQSTTLSPQLSTLKLQSATLNPQPSTLNPQPSTLNPQPSTLNPQPSKINSQKSTLNPLPSTLNPKPQTQEIANKFFYMVAPSEAANKL